MTQPGQQQPEPADHVVASDYEPRPTRIYLSRLIEILSEVTDRDTVINAVKRARGHAGGKARQQKRREQKEREYSDDELAANDQNSDEQIIEPHAHVHALLDESDMDQEEVHVEVVEISDPTLPVKFEKQDERVNYRDATDPGQTCQECAFFKYNGGFEGQYRCALVEGRIRKRDVCDLFVSVEEEYSETKTDVDDAELTEQLEIYTIGAQDQDERLISLFTQIPATFNEAVPEYIPLLPKPGIYKHPRYGDIVITRQRNENFVDNINKQVYQKWIPIDAEHQTKLSGAFGFIVGAQMNEDGSADAQVEWNEKGTQVISERRFRYISPEWLLRYQDPASGDIHEDVVVAAALTNNPFFKEPNLRPLVANERGVWDVRNATDGEGTTVIILQMCDGLTSSHNEHDERSLSMGEQQHTPDVEETQDDGELQQATEDPVADEQDETTEPNEESTEVHTEVNEEQAMKATEEFVNEETLGQLPDDVKQTFNQMRTMIEESREIIDAERQTAQQYREKLELADQRIKAMEDSARRERFTAMVQGRSGEDDGAQWFGEPQKHVEMLESLAEAFGEDSAQFTQYVELQRATAAQLHQSPLMKEIGSPEQGASDAWRRIEAKAEDYRQKYAEKDMTLQQAIAEVTKSYPELHEEYLKERGIS